MCRSSDSGRLHTSGGTDYSCGGARRRATASLRRPGTSWSGSAGRSRREGKGGRGASCGVAAPYGEALPQGATPPWPRRISLCEVVMPSLDASSVLCSPLALVMRGVAVCVCVQPASGPRNRQCVRERGSWSRSKLLREIYQILYNAGRYCTVQFCTGHSPNCSAHP